MYVITVPGVNAAYAQGLRYICERGELQNSRAGQVLVAPTPVTIVYEKPQERVLFDPSRDANPFFHLFEALHMLAGRNDAKWLDQFVKDFSSRFAESDGIQHGAYGYRWRNHFDLEGGGNPNLPDQLDTVVQMLVKDPQSRRAVISMWDPAADLGANKKDMPCNTHVYLRVRTNRDYVHGNWKDTSVLDLAVCCRSNDFVWGMAGANACLAGDTIISSPEGDISIKALARKFSSGKLKNYPVYSFDPVSKDLKISWCTRAWSVGKKKVLELEFDEGTFLKCTADHKLYKKKWNNSKFCKEVQVGELCVGDRVWATQVWENKEGRRYIKKNLGKDTQYTNMVKVAREYYAFRTGKVLTENFDVHHKDENKSNDGFTNLEKITRSDHSKHHIIKNHPMSSQKARAKASASRKQYFANMSKEEYAEYCQVREGHIPSDETRDKMSVSHKANWENKPEVEKQEQLRRLHSAPHSDWWEGKKHKADTIAKMSETRRKWWAERKRQSNHKIVAIRELPEEEVYDFTVPGDHNAMLDNGVMVHNCHFSILQEYLAGRLGVEVGRYYQIANNAHLYTSILPKLDKPQNLAFYPGTRAIGTVWDYWDNDLNKFMVWTTLDNPAKADLSYANAWFKDTAEPMFYAHWLWRFARKQEAVDYLFNAKSMAPDWNRAALEWMQRRMARSMSKQEKVAHGR